MKGGTNNESLYCLHECLCFVEAILCVGSLIQCLIDAFVSTKGRVQEQSTGFTAETMLLMCSETRCLSHVDQCYSTRVEQDP